MFQSEFSTQSKLILSHSVASIFSFPKGHPLAAYAFFLVVFSLLSFSIVFYKAVPMQDVPNPVSFASFYCIYDVPFLIDCL